MSHARVEEVSDSDPEIDDPSSLPSSSTIILPGDIPQPGSSSLPKPLQNTPRSAGPNAPTPPTKESIKSHSTLYPVYFDASRSRAQGRRVSSKLAVQNPLAREIAEACRYVSMSMASGQLPIAFEPDKTHPKDWANPGRVRILLRDESTGKPLSRAGGVKNKSHLYILVAEYLRAHPTTKESPLKLRIQGMPVPEKLEPPAVPKGWKINDILPLHSAAMSGGGVSENFFKDMMAGMQGAGGAGGPQLPLGMPGMPQLAGEPEVGAGSGREGNKKKNKKKGK